jgi:hypothetical protein
MNDEAFFLEYHQLQLFWSSCQLEDAHHSLNRMIQLIDANPALISTTPIVDFVADIWSKIMGTQIPLLLGSLTCLLKFMITASTRDRPAVAALLGPSALATAYPILPAEARKCLHDLLIVLLDEMVGSHPTEFLEFVLNYFPDSSNSLNQAILIKKIFRCLSGCCRLVPPEVLLDSLSAIFRILLTFAHPPKIYYFYGSVTDVAFKIVSREVDLFEVNRPFFDLMVKALMDCRLQPHRCVIRIIDVLLYFHESDALVDAIPIRRLLHILQGSERDDQDTVAVVSLFANIIVARPALIEMFCCPQALGLLAVLGTTKRYDIRKAVI